MTAWLADWGPFLILIGVFALVAAGAMVADAIGSHRLRVALLVSAMRRGDDQ
jgi:hypothetical protein